jgi:hypothetical protein
MGEMKNSYKILVVNLKAKDNLGNLGADGIIIIKRILEN